MNSLGACAPILPHRKCDEEDTMSYYGQTTIQCPICQVQAGEPCRDGGPFGHSARDTLARAMRLSEPRRAAAAARLPVIRRVWADDRAWIVDPDLAVLRAWLKAPSQETWLDAYKTALKIESWLADYAQRCNLAMEARLDAGGRAIHDLIDILRNETDEAAAASPVRE